MWSTISFKMYSTCDPSTGYMVNTFWMLLIFPMCFTCNRNVSGTCIWVHWGHMTGYILNAINNYPLITLNSHFWAHFECIWFLPTGHIMITCWLDPQCVQHVPTGYLGPRPQWDLPRLDRWQSIDRRTASIASDTSSTFISLSSAIGTNSITTGAGSLALGTRFSLLLPSADDGGRDWSVRG